MNAVAERPQVEMRRAASPFALGTAVTNRDGTPARLCRAMKAPFWVCVDGVVVADFGQDEAAAEAMYAPLLYAVRSAEGNLQPIVLGNKLADALAEAARMGVAA